MAGYTRQSIASIINGEDITAPPLTAEFNQLQDAFNGSTGHSHDGSTGNAPKIDLTTSVSGYLPAIHGGIGGKNNFAATTNPTSTDDSTQGYAPGSMWENTTTGRVFICVGNTSSAAVWRELVQVISGNQITPETTNSVDLGTPSVRFQDLYLSGGIAAAGNVTVGGTTTVTGATTLNNTLTVAGTTLLNGNITLGDADTDNITVTGEFVSGLTPNTTGTYDLGTSTKEWRDLYIDGTAHVDTLDVDENAGIVGNLSVTGNSTLTGTLGVTGTTTVVDLAATGTTTITSGDINSGAMDGTTIGASTPAAGTFTTLTANTSLTAATADINGGTIDNATIGATTPSSAAFTTASTSGLATLASVDINGGAIDGTTIGATSHTSGKFSTLQSTGNATLATVDINGGTIDGTSIGSASASSGAFTTLSASGGITGDLTGDVTGNLTGNVTGNITGNITGNVTGNVTASSGTSTFTNVTINGNLDMNAGTTATITNLTTPTNANDAATKGYVDASVANLVDSAPGTLDTLNELAAALNDDPNFSTTITNSIATKLPLAGGTMTGAIAMGTSKITGMGDPTAAQDAATKNYVDNQDALQVTKTGDSMSGALAMGSNNITGLATPTANDHAANKSYVDGILGSATAASASASAAATSETNAATSATNAANSASAAAADRATVASIYDQFDDRYLGAKGSAPTVDNDGNALITGALYFNSTSNIMYVYGSSGWVPAGSSVNGTTDRVTYTASAGQTVFAATYDAGYVDVYMNGVKLLAGTDFTATNGTSITLASGAAVNDVIDIVAYGTFTLADHYTKTEADNRYVNAAGDTMTGALTTTGLTVNGNSSVTGALDVGGDLGLGSKLDVYSASYQNLAVLRSVPSDGVNPYLAITSSSSGITLEENGSSYANLMFKTGGSEAARFDSSGNFLVNHTSTTDWTNTVGAQVRGTGYVIGTVDGDYPFIANRLTSNGDLMQFRRDGVAIGSIGSHAGDYLTIGEGASGLIFNVSTASVRPWNMDNTTSPDGVMNLGATNGRFNQLHLSGATYYGLVNSSQFIVGKSGADNRIWDRSGGNIEFLTGDLQRFKITNSEVVVNDDSYDVDFRIESNDRTDMFFVNALTNCIGVRTTGPVKPLSLGSRTGSALSYINGTNNVLNEDNGIFVAGSTTDETSVVYGLHLANNSATNGARSPIIGFSALSSSGGFNHMYAAINGVKVNNGADTNWNTGNIDFSTGAGTGPAVRMTLDYLGGLTLRPLYQGSFVWNEDGQDSDFRVESDSNSHLFYVDGQSAYPFVCIGASSGGGQYAGTGANGFSVNQAGMAGQYVTIQNQTDANLYLSKASGYTSGVVASFWLNGAAKGNISIDASGTTYSTTSDRRLKTDIQPIADATEKLMAMNPVTHKWIADPEADAVHGFIAQEMQDIVPEAVSGDPEGEEMMSMDYGRITPVLVAALQDAHKKIEALEARINEMENK